MIYDLLFTKPWATRTWKPPPPPQQQQQQQQQQKRADMKKGHHGTRHMLLNPRLLGSIHISSSLPSYKYIHLWRIKKKERKKERKKEKEKRRKETADRV